ncbi:SNF1-related protein kinase catalytic subunit alpha KIN10-like [Arachis stenosperma]|uniref:SNF1-related protein kinase catalytic subunit alpha KIN10-like n=1 Tax=Arachis stenosperma TaxID=217475 RepID=UPI0025AD2189|nr:SNF1-related protein kinase catalytic subunit alpha KIN10-like [Arachis stenosperma]
MDGGGEMFVGNYKLGKVIGHGCFGKVRIAQHLPTDHKVAIKILNLHKINQIKMEDKVRREIKVLRVFMHPHIVRLYEVVETLTDIYVVMEYAESGDLNDYIIIQKDRLPEDQARKFFQQIICGVEYCHRNMVVHRDLKPDNLLLNSKGNIKIADFGFCNIMRDGHPLTTSCGSPLYAAPEVVSGKPYAGPEVDVWSCGVILYALLCAHLPFEDDNVPNLFKKIKGGIYSVPRHVSDGARDLIKGMLVVDPMKRLTIPAIRQHPWFRLHLPPYLAFPPPPHTNQQQNKIIDEEVLQEVVNKGFNKNQLVESLQNNIQNEGTVAYSLLLDNKLCDSNGYLGPKFQESMDLDFNRILSREVVSSVVGPCFSRSMNNPRVSLRPQFSVERKWALGLQSGAHPREIITEVLKALRELQVCWKKIGHYNIKCLWVNNHDLGDYGSNNVDNDIATSSASNVIKFEVQLYKTAEGKYLLDLQRVQGPQLLFLDLCVAFLFKLRVL